MLVGLGPPDRRPELGGRSLRPGGARPWAGALPSEVRPILVVRATVAGALALWTGVASLANRSSLMDAVVQGRHPLRGDGEVIVSEPAVQSLSIRHVLESARETGDAQSTTWNRADRGPSSSRAFGPS